MVFCVWKPTGAFSQLHTDNITYYTNSLITVTPGTIFYAINELSYLASFLVRLFVEMKSEVADSREVVELKVLAPEDSVGAGFAGGACIQHVVQTQFTVVTFFGWQLPGLDDPELQDIVHSPTVVLSVRKERIAQYWSRHVGVWRKNMEIKK